MKVTGVIKVLKDTNQVSEKYSKRELVVTTNDQHPQDISIEFSQDKCSLLDSFEIGQNVDVSINFKGREWTSPQGEVKYFNTVQGWNISLI